MRKILLLLLLFSATVFGQENKPQYNLEWGYYYGSILPHSEKILHLIQKHPEGIFINLHRKTFGEKEWQARLNYPDYGIGFHYQNNKNEVLGDLYGLYAHYNFYFLNRNLQFRVAQGIAYNTHPYHREDNYRNLAFGMHFMPATYFMLNFQKENIWEGLGVQAGVFLIHHSNGKMKTPNTSTNTVGANLSLLYTLGNDKVRKYIPREPSDSVFHQPIRINLALRSGMHESHIIGSGKHAFYNFSVYADKQISPSSSFQLGADLFLSQMRKHEIPMMGNAFPEKNIDPQADYKRLGMFVGYELFINRLSFEPQLGYYLYNKYPEDKALYQRLGLKYYFYKDLFTGMGLLSQSSKAEALEFSLGIRW